MSSTNVGQISLDLILNSKEFDNKLNQKLNEVGKTTSNKLNSTFSKLGKTIAGAFAVGAVVKFGKECLDLGSDLQEVQNVVDSTFTTLSDKVNEYASEAINKLGMSETAYKRYIGTMGAMSKSFGFTEEEALNMSKTLVELTGDVASFYNLDHDTAYNKMKAVYTGETESLKELGVVMTQSALDQFALNNGFGKTTAAMSEQEKVALRYAFVQDKLKTASGDFIRTQNGWANQTRILTMQFQALKASIGQGLINALTPVIKVMNILLSKINAVAKSFASLTAKIFGDASGGSGSISSSVSDVGVAADGASESIGGIGDATSEAAKKANKALMGFDEINKLSAPVEDVSAGGGAGSVGSVGFGDETSTAIDEATQKETVFEKALDRIIKRATELKNIFVEGFKFGLDATGFENSISRIKESTKGIKEHLKDIFDAETGAAFSNMLDKIAKSLGEIGGAAVGAGMKIAADLLEGFENFLGLNKGTIKETLITIFDEIGNSFERLSEILVPNMEKIIKTILKVVAAFLLIKTIITTVSFITTAITTISTVLGTLKSSLSFVTLGTKLFGAAFTALTSPVGIAVAAIVGVIAIVALMYTKFESTREAVNSLFENLKIAFENFKEGFNTLFESLKGTYEKHIEPIITLLKEKITDCINNTIVPLINKTIEFIGKLIEQISIIWKEWLAPFIGWLVEKIVATVAPIAEELVKIGFNLLSRIGKVIEGLMDVLTGIIDFIIAVFSGDWEKAIDLIKQIGIDGFNALKEAIFGIIETIFSSIKIKFSGLLDIIRTPINAAIKMLNKVGLNIEELPAPEVGGTGGRGHFDVPALASGGYVKPNQPTLAMVGDNRHAGEIVAPEDKMAEVFVSVLDKYFGNLNTNQNNNNRPIENTMIVQLDGKTIYKEMKSYNNKESNRTGSKQFR